MYYMISGGGQKSETNRSTILLYMVQYYTINHTHYDRGRLHRSYGIGLGISDVTYDKIRLWYKWYFTILAWDENYITQWYCVGRPVAYPKKRKKELLLH